MLDVKVVVFLQFIVSVFSFGRTGGEALFVQDHQGKTIEGGSC